MRLQFTNKDGVYTAHLADKLTFADHSLFRKLLEDVKESKCAKCVFDLKDLNLIDSSGLGMIMIAIDEAKKNAWSLHVTGAVGPVKQLLQLSRLDQLLAA